LIKHQHYKSEKKTGFVRQWTALGTSNN